MKMFKWYLIASLVMVALCAVTLSLLRQPTTVPTASSGEQRFHVRGEVREIDPQSKSIRIKHEEIPNYMAAMTMPFDLRDTKILRGLKAGDEIGFELVVTKDDSWIASIQKLSEASAAGPADVAQAPSSDIQRVEVGETVPDFELTSQNGIPIHLRDFRGKMVLLTFIYTRCPLPNFCPLMSKNFALLQERLQKRFPGRFQLLSVSIDPEYDRPEVLKAYASHYSQDDSTWTFGTGRSEQTDAVGALFGLIQERAGGFINHDLRTALIGPDGRLIHVWKSNAWTPYEIDRRISESLSPAS